MRAEYSEHAAPREAAPTVAWPLRSAMTVDVEDYFQVSAFDELLDRAAWQDQPSRISRNVDRVLELFSDAGVHATFFTLGWIAERNPGLIRRVVSEGHEVASHGMAHHRVSDQSPETFRADVLRSRLLLEDVSGTAVVGYRAASFSMGPQTPWAHDILVETGYRYSSSIYPIRHDHYGDPDAPRFPFRPSGVGGFIEVPVTTLNMFGRNLPVGGGGYFRLLPYAAYRRALRRFLHRDGRPAVFYFHPWELDPHQPRPVALSPRTRLRHYLNLDRMESRLRSLLDDFSWDRMDRVFGIRDTA